MKGEQSGGKEKKEGIISSRRDVARDPRRQRDVSLSSLFDFAGEFRVSCELFVLLRAFSRFPACHTAPMYER